MMQKTTMLRENYLFRRIYHKGKRLSCPCATIYYIRMRNHAGNRLGITVTKKIGGAVTRNRARRVILEAYRLLEPTLPSGLDIVIVSRPGAATSKMQTVKKELGGLFQKLNQQK